jgi:hypothetical protein
MVKKRTDKGGTYYEPPYTEEEETMIDQALSGDGPVKILHGSPPSERTRPPQKTPQPSPEE